MDPHVANHVYFGPEDWSGLWRNRHHLMVRFARHANCVYVEPAAFLKDLRIALRNREISLGDLLRDLTRDPLREVAPGMYVYRRRLAAPLTPRRPLKSLLDAWWRYLLKRSLRKLGIDRPVIWLSRPTMEDYIGAVNESISIYHVVDEYLAYANVAARRAAQAASEQSILDQVDVTIVVSTPLLEAKTGPGRNVRLIENGVDFAAYDQAIQDDVAAPADIADLPRPLIGYSGLISARLDIPLLIEAANRMPHASFVFLGELSEDHGTDGLDDLRGQSNIHLVGRREFADVPAYVRQFDIGIIPYAISEETANLSPLKLYDFLAIGMPVVVTQFPAANAFSKVIRIAGSKDDFLSQLELCQQHDDPDARETRRNVARENSWDNRFEEIRNILASLPTKPGSAS